MRIPVFLLALVLFSCGQGPADKKKNDADSAGKVTDTTDSRDFTIKDVGESIRFNSILRQKGSGQWHVVTDQESGWTKDVMDYFVVNERKNDPEFPYIAKGDYDCDGIRDIAALVTDSSNSKSMIVFLLKEGKEMRWWTEDVKGGAIANLPKTEVTGFGEDIDEEKKVKMPCDGVNVVWFESASYVVYWNGSKFDRIGTSD